MKKSFPTNLLVIGMMALSFTLLVGCGRAPAPEVPNAAVKPSPITSAEPVVSMLDAKDGKWGNLKGRIVWGGGAFPELKTIEASQDKAHCTSQGAIPDEGWVIDKESKGVRWTLVWLAPEPPKDKIPVNEWKKLDIHPDLQEIKVKEVEVDQPCCRFIPHALGMRQGQHLVVRNSSPIPHNVNCTSNVDGAGFSILIPPGGSHTAKNMKPERLPQQISCNIHGWMNAKIGVFDHPYFAVTDEKGNFEIKQAPAGHCRLKIWQENVGWRGGKLGKDGEAIEIKGGSVSDLGKIELKPND